MNPEPKSKVAERALRLVLDERDHQRSRWTTDHDARHTPDEWLAILTVWMGKAAMASPIYQGPGASRVEFNKRLAQVAAICTAAIEANLDEEDERLPVSEDEEHSSRS